MRRHLSWTVALMAIGTSGCQTYSARPIDLGRVFEDLRLTTAEPSVNVSDGLTLAEAERLTLVLSPELRRARLAAGVTRASLDHAGAFPNPSLGVDVSGILHDVPSPWRLSTGIAFTVPLSGRLGAEVRRATAGHRASLFRVAQRERDVLATLRSNWLRWSAATRRIALVEAHLAVARPLLPRIEALAKDGEVGLSEAGLLAAVLRSRAARLTWLRSEAERLRLEVLATVGLTATSGATLTAITELPEVTRVTDEALGHHPAVREAVAEYAASEAALEREVSGQYPDLGIGLTTDHDQGKWGLGIGLTIPLPFFDRNQRGIAEAQARRELRGSGVSRAASRLLAERSLAEAARASALDRQRTLQDDVLPAVKAQLARLRKMIAAGEVSALLLDDALSRALEIDEALLDAALELNLARARLMALAPEVSP